MFIVAREITSKDVGAPGAIAYEAPGAGDVPPEPGQAQAGRRGGDDGDNGGAGQAGGEREVTAVPGCSAPNLTIVVLSAPGPGPRVDFGGRRGGEGGRGGAGGTVTIIAPSDLLPDLARKFGVQVSGGTGGDPGLAGPDGDAGLRGPGGVDGSFFVGAIAEETFERIYEDR
jgi:hypothetical protein